MGIVKSNFREVSAVRALASSTINNNNANNGVAVDTRDATSCLFLLQFGAIHADVSIGVKLQHSDQSGAGWEDVGAEGDGYPSQALIEKAAIDGDDDNKVFKASYLGIKRYVRVVLTAAGAAAGKTAVVSAVAVLTGLRYQK